MIALSVYLSPKAGAADELDRVVRDVWMKAMAEQPGFLRGAVVKPFDDEALAALEATRPAYTCEVVSYWESEASRVAWTQRDIHQEVWPQVLEQAASVSYCLFNVTGNWNL
jgi:heme-degrading monooxygenase HmoA